MIKGRRRWTKRRGAVALVVASTTMIAGQKTYEYSADPAGEKSCPPLTAGFGQHRPTRRSPAASATPDHPSAPT